jgi:hypothetical protein
VTAEGADVPTPRDRPPFARDTMPIVPWGPSATRSERAVSDESHRLALLRAVLSFVDTNGGDLPLGLLDSIRAEVGGPR